ncbi:MAG: hypothetical protein PGN19_16850 [Pseudomonas oryzihabitans]
MTLRISRQHWLVLLDELEGARRSRSLLTYRSVIERVGLPQPAMMTLTAALEYLAALDRRAGRPLRSALVVSQSGSRLPREGFFDCVLRLGALDGASPYADAVSWHAAEVTRVFEHRYPDHREA